MCLVESVTKKGDFLLAEAGTGGAVADMTDEYAQSTLQVAGVIEKYANLEPFDPSRPSVVKVCSQLTSLSGMIFK